MAAKILRSGPHSHLLDVRSQVAVVVDELMPTDGRFILSLPSHFLPANQRQPRSCDLHVDETQDIKFPTSALPSKQPNVILRRKYPFLMFDLTISSLTLLANFRDSPTATSRRSPTERNSKPRLQSVSVTDPTGRMSEDKSQVHAATGDPPPASYDQNAVPTAETAATGSMPSSASSSTRIPYVPQFSATTELILQRIRGRSESATTQSALPPVGNTSGAGAIQQSSYEDTRRRLMNSMNTSLTLAMPASAVVPPQLSLRGPAFIQESPSAQQRSRPDAVPARGGARGGSRRAGRSTRGTKRKRGKNSSEDGSDLSDDASSHGRDGTYRDTPVTTKSGRQISRPVQFNPSTPSSTGKRRHYGKRTADQALCKVCTRGLSPMNNQIVFCDGCNACWHQLCHDPMIGNEFVSDEARAWFCRGCLAKRERSNGGSKKRVSTEIAKGVSWAARSAEQRSAYLRGLPRQELLNLLTYSVELHTDLPIFPASATNGPAKRRAPALFPGPEASSGAATGRSVNFIRKISPPSTSSDHYNGKNATPSTAPPGGPNSDMGQEQDDSDEVPPAWPKVGQGVLDTAGISLRDSDFEDNDDYESFSVMTFDRQGRKIMENGKHVTKENDGERERKLRNELS